MDTNSLLFARHNILILSLPALFSPDCNIFCTIATDTNSNGIAFTCAGQVLATELFNDEKTMVQLDMSEYVEPHTVYRLIGSPPGCK
jgi:hypothetical protein